VTSHSCFYFLLFSVVILSLNARKKGALLERDEKGVLFAFWENRLLVAERTTDDK